FEGFGAADLELEGSGDGRLLAGAMFAREESLEHDPQLPDGERSARQHDEFDQLAPRHVVVLGPVDGEVAPPSGLVLDRLRRRPRGQVQNSLRRFVLAHGDRTSAKTSSSTSWPMVGSCMAAVTSRCARCSCLGTMTLTLVRM